MLHTKLLLPASCSATSCHKQQQLLMQQDPHQYLTDLHLLHCVVVGLLQILHSPTSMDIRLAIAARSHHGSPSKEVLAANECCCSSCESRHKPATLQDTTAVPSNVKRGVTQLCVCDGRQTSNTDTAEACEL
jgi:hypothetical protein